MTDGTSRNVQKICRSEELAEGGARIFSWRAKGWWGKGFAFRHKGMLHAYRNQCPHQPLTLDYGDGDFFDPETNLLACRNHGALFEPETGKCVAGPCAGASLQKLRVWEDQREIYVEIPADHFPELD